MRWVASVVNPPISDIPTLSQWDLLPLATLLALTALRRGPMRVERR